MADNVLPFRRRTDPAPPSSEAPSSQAVPDAAADTAVPPRRAEPAPTRVPARREAPEPLWREALGEQLREHRTGRGERIADVADRAGVSPQYLSEIERGLKDPSSEVLAAVSGALGLSVQELARTVSLRLAGGAVGPVCLAA